MKVALFLGAGASVPYDKPVTSALKDRLIVKYGGSNDELHSVIHALVSKKSLPDIEYVLQAIRDLATFSETHAAYALFFDNAPDWTLNTNSRNVELRKIIRQTPELRKIIERDVFEHYRWHKKTDTAVVAILEQIFKVLSNQAPEVNVFTTNYDKAIERFCRLSSGYACVDGFDWDSEIKANVWQNKFSYNGRRIPVYLHKLHGSLGWKEHADGMIVNTDVEGISDDHNFENNVLVYPTLCPKDGEEREPFKSIRDRFDQYMTEAEYCFVIGFSFRDEHINKIFRKFLERRGRMAVLSPTASDDFAKNFRKFETIPPTDEERQKYVPRLLANMSLTMENASGFARTIEKVIQEDP
jgi:hypothetical protein